MSGPRLIRGLLVLAGVASMSFVAPSRPELKPVPSSRLEVELERSVLADMLDCPAVRAESSRYTAYVILTDDEATDAALAKAFAGHSPPVRGRSTITVSQPGDIAIDANTGGRVLIFHLLTNRVDDGLADVLASCNSGNHVPDSGGTYEMRRRNGGWGINRRVRGVIRRYFGTMP